MILSDDFGIDLGSDTIKIYDLREDNNYSETTMVAVRKDGRIVALGEDAREMYGTTPRSISIRTPVTGGKINDVMLLDAILVDVLYKHHRFLGIKPTLYFSVPADMTEIERRAFVSISKRGRLKNCSIFIVERAFADAMALDIPVTETKGVMIVNIGAENADASVIADGRIILNRAVPHAGNSINENVIAAVRRKNNLAIGLASAELAKRRMGGFDGSGETGMSLKGLDTQTGLPRDGFVTRNTILKAMTETIDALAEELDEFIHRIPPQVYERVSREGIYLTGGSSRIPGISRYLSGKFGLPVREPQIFEYSTVSGLNKMMHNDELHRFANTPVTR